jgi:hypothetical protein
VTVHSLADYRAARVPAARLNGDDPATAPDPEEVTEWKLLAERAARIVGDLEAAAANPDTCRDFAALVTEAAGLRAAMDGAVRRRLKVASLLDAGYAMALAGRSPGGGV